MIGKQVRHLIKGWLGVVEHQVVQTRRYDSESDIPLYCFERLAR